MQRCTIFFNENPSQREKKKVSNEKPIYPSRKYSQPDETKKKHGGNKDVCKINWISNQRLTLTRQQRSIYFVFDLV